MSLIELSWTAKKQISIKLTFLHGLGLISKLALNCLLCAAVNIVRGRFGPLVLSGLYTLCHFCINISAIVIINACIIMVVVVLVLRHLILLLEFSSTSLVVLVVYYY